MSYSCQGFEGLSSHFHQFIRSYILRGMWANQPRPVLINTWEAAYFNFNEDTILEMAASAKKLGIELLVLDDGWFGKRNSAKTSMGDWYCNLEKLPNGISGLSQKIHDMGLQFGIWVEPEALSVDSDLYRAHPEWSLSIPGQHHSLGRNEHLLDFSNPAVIDYIYVRMPRETEDYTLPGDFLNNCGIRLKSDFNGHNLDEDTRYYTDYATRLYDFEMIESQD